MTTSVSAKFFLCILALFIPFLAVAFQTGCGDDLLINLPLCILIWPIAIFHAWWVICWRGPPRYSHRDWDADGRRQ